MGNKARIVVNRNKLILHSKGILLDRDEYGRCLVGDGVELEQAVEAMRTGATIYLEDKGIIVSKMFFDKKTKSYQEQAI